MSDRRQGKQERHRGVEDGGKREKGRRNALVEHVGDHFDFRLRRCDLLRARRLRFPAKEGHGGVGAACDVGTVGVVRSNAVGVLFEADVVVDG